ncbi:nucleotide sugar dehydrogenase [Pseudoruegeria sp. SK021]|uniref:nucleotide sugar dehydrogenase n=1 Tax=Pseudoruegeria sp. SK021 TaxID=1933035 RepID=UPI000A231A1E|nr:nucleotide sugar dehydrogenase [Pseudoruegeria sp. SK021]OSP54081.1 GDP-mannose dehydrogenase [Pseudoruegeria sp. SK021]
MKVVIFGLGYVGFTAACCISSEGHSVVGIDVSDKKVKSILDGHAPIVEPGVQEMLLEGLEKGLITAATSIGDNLDGADLAIVCVGTPSAADGSHNMGYIADVSRQIALALKGADRARPLAVAYRSTIRPGSIQDLILPIFQSVLGEDASGLFDLIYNPEFLRESSAVKDYFEPPKIVIGTQDGQPNPVMEELNTNITAPTFYVGYREAEFTKFVDNTWHAVKVAYANEIGRVCLNLGIQASTVHEIFKSDTKLNISAYYTRPGGAFGGSCLPKDVRALQYIGADSGTSMPLVESLIRTNEAHKHRLYEYAVDGLEPGAKVLLAGLAFKAATDDLRESPNVDLARKMLQAGFAVEIYDPAINAEKLVGTNLGYAYSQLPMIQSLLVDKATADSGSYARVIAANATVKELDLPAGSDIRDLGSL